jgi:hypothetical protein
VAEFDKLEAVNTDAIDPVTSKAFTEKLIGLGHLNALIAQRRGLVEKLDDLDRLHNDLANFIRLNYTAEIAAGSHAGLSLAEVAIRYMKRERAHHRTFLNRVRLAIRGKEY